MSDFQGSCRFVYCRGGGQAKPCPFDCACPCHQPAAEERCPKCKQLLTAGAQLKSRLDAIDAYGRVVLRQAGWAP